LYPRYCDRFRIFFLSRPTKSNFDVGIARIGGSRHRRFNLV
jgi:hypothetical protein